LGVYPGTTQGVAFSPTFATSFMGATYTNINSAVTLTLYDQTAGAVVWSGVATGGFTGNIGQFTLGQYPMPAGHSFVWQLTSTTAATASIWMAPIYAFPAASPTYNVSCMGTVGVINASMTGAPTMKVGNTAIAYSSKFSKASQVYSVTINNQSNFVVTCKLIYNGGTSPVLFSAAAPANAVTTFGPYALGAYVMNAGYQYYWTATGSGTGSVFLDMFVAFSIA
jgi:hypothetical protein